MARVRAELGLLVRHPHRITVTSDNRCVTLRGPIQADELYRLLDRVASVPGVAHVEDRLEMHGMDAADLPAEPLPQGDLPDLLQEHWSPASRLLAGTLGGGLAVGAQAAGHGSGGVAQEPAADEEKGEDADDVVANPFALTGHEVVGLVAVGLTLDGLPAA